MANKKVKKTPIWKTSGFYFALVYAVLTIAFVLQLFMVNVIPFKYMAAISVVLIILLIGLSLLQLGKRVNKINRILGKVIIVILCAVLGFGNWMMFKTNSAFGKMTGDSGQTDIMSVIVLKDNEMKEIKDLKGKKLGVIKIGDTSLNTKAEADIEKDLGEKVTTVEYTSYKTFADDLYAGTVDAILLNEASRGLIEDNHETFDNDTRALKEYKYEKETEDISKNVNVTKEAFNIYITGIDTYGGISTVSRSDVNMIMTVNPETHQILLTSIPRDYYVPQPCQGGQTDKLTHTGIFGVECTIGSVEDYFGVELNYYARVNFSSLENIVNALGGITVDNPHAFSAGGFSYEVGSIHLNGPEALMYSRERYSFADGDRERGRDQMRVITGIINKATSPAIITNYAGIMDAIGDSFQTNMSNSEMTSLIKMQINDMSGWDIEQISVSGTGNGSAWSPANGFNSWVMEPNIETVKNAVSLIKKVENGGTVTAADVEQQNSLVSSAG